MEEEFKTYDLALAAALENLGHTIVKFDKTQLRRVQFVFEATDELRGDVEKYWAKKLLVEPLSFHSNIRNLKSQIYEGSR